MEVGFDRLGGCETGRSRHEAISVIRVFEEFADGLDGLGEYSDIMVIYWIHEEKEVKLRVSLGAVT